VESGVSAEEPQQPRTMGEAFDEAFPHYLLMGMTDKQFWDEDCALVVPYRKAYQLKQEEKNYTAWLNGLYIWKALQTAPIYVNGFMPKGASVEPYYEKPIEFAKPKKKENKLQEHERMKQNGIDFMNKLAGTFNRQFEKKQQEERLKKAKAGKEG